MTALLQEMRKELQSVREQLAVPLSKAQENQELLDARLEEQYQTKVESTSRYRVRLSGAVLFNLFGNKGTVDNIDFPSLVLERRPTDSGGSFGGSLRQSMIGFDVSGPQIHGAHVDADVQFDFAGGFPASPGGDRKSVV